MVARRLWYDTRRWAWFGDLNLWCFARDFWLRHRLTPKIGFGLFWIDHLNRYPSFTQDIRHAVGLRGTGSPGDSRARIAGQELSQFIGCATQLRGGFTGDTLCHLGTERFDQMNAVWVCHGLPPSAGGTGY